MFLVCEKDVCDHMMSKWNICNFSALASMTHCDRSRSSQNEIKVDFVVLQVHADVVKISGNKKALQSFTEFNSYSFFLHFPVFGLWLKC